MPIGKRFQRLCGSLPEGELTGLDEGGRELARQIMLTGHDGAHPHLPEVDQARAAVLLSLLQDLTYQLYTRPGKAREAAELRQRAVDSLKGGVAR